MRSKRIRGKEKAIKFETRLNLEGQTGRQHGPHSVYAVLIHSACAIHYCYERGLMQGSGAEYEGWNFNIGNYLFTTDTK